MLSFHCNGANNYLFVNGREIIKFNAKDSEIVASPLCLGDISKDFSVDNIKKTGLNGYVYGLSANYDAIAICDIYTFIRIWWKIIIEYKIFEFGKKYFL